MPDRPDPSRPPPSGHAGEVDELDLLGWVEGDLPRARQQPVEELLAREPRLRALLDAMAADRAALRSLPPEPIPADLLSRVEAQLERELLVGLAGPATETLDIPISRVVVKGDGILARIGRSPVLRYAPLAASILIVGAIGLVMWPSIARRPGAPSGAQPPMLITPGSLARATPESGAEAATLAEAPLAKSEPVPSLNDLAIAQADSADTLSPADESVTPDRAAELLKEGRLAIRVRTLDRDKTFQRLASIHAEPRSTWALLDRADESVIAAFTPAPAEPGINARLLASGTSEEPADFVPPLLSLQPRQPLPRAIYIAEVDATPRALATLRGVLGSGSKQVAEFVALEAPVATPAPASVESILWWKRPPSAWVVRHTLPVLVDPVDTPR